MGVNRMVLRAGVMFFALAVLFLLPGCPVAGFQFFFVNSGDYPVVGVFIVPSDAADWGKNRLELVVPAGETATIPAKFSAGAVYDVAVFYNIAPETAEGNLVPLYSQVDTSALNADYVTLWATYKTGGANGLSYGYGLPD